MESAVNIYDMMGSDAIISGYGGKFCQFFMIWCNCSAANVGGY